MAFHEIAEYGALTQAQKAAFAASKTLYQALRADGGCEQEAGMKDLLTENEVADGINVIIDERFAAIFPMECRSQVEHLIKSVNLAHRQRLDEAHSHT